MRTGVPLTLACGDYDRTRPLHDGTVRPEGVDLTCLALPVEEIFFRMARFGEFDAAELSLSSYLVSMTEQGPGRFVAIPVFPSRAFRHSGIYVNTASGVDAPERLVGRTVGVAEYQLTAVVWIRGILQDHHGVPVDSVHYRTGGLHRPGRREKLAVRLPPGVRVTPIGPGETLSDLLVAGRIDAIYSPRTPRCFLDRRPEVARLFPDFRTVEEEYFRATGIFPIMHVVVLRREVYEANRWLARSLYKAFEAARVQAMSGMAETAALRFALPWLVAEVERTRELLGEDYWTYGLAGNEPALRTIIRYAHEQGLAARAFAPEELFAPETLEDTVV